MLKRAIVDKNPFARKMLYQWSFKSEEDLRKDLIIEELDEPVIMSASCSTLKHSRDLEPEGQTSGFQTAAPMPEIVGLDELKAAEIQNAVNMDPLATIEYYNQAHGDARIPMTVGTERLLNNVDPETIGVGLAKVRELRPRKEGGAVLDAGAGWGARAWVLLEFYDHYFSFDMMQTFVTQFNFEMKPHLTMFSKKDIQPMVCARAQDVEAVGFEAVFFHHLLVHFSAVETVLLLTNAATWLNPGGVIIVKEPSCHEEAIQRYRGGVIIIRRSREQWIALFFKSGLSVQHVVEGKAIEGYERDNLYILTPALSYANVQ